MRDELVARQHYAIRVLAPETVSVLAARRLRAQPGWVAYGTISVIVVAPWLSAGYLTLSTTVVVSFGFEVRSRQRLASAHREPTVPSRHADRWAYPCLVPSTVMFSAGEPTWVRRRSPLTPLVVLCAALAIVTGVGLTIASGGQHYAQLGLPDAGPFTEDGLALLRVLFQVGAALCVGSLLLAAFLAPPRHLGALAVDGYAALRNAGWAALGWSVAALLLVPFTVADALGRPVGLALDPGVLLPLVFELDQPRAWLLTCAVAAAVAVGCRLALSWRGATLLFFLALAGLVPLAVTGHSSAGGSHDVATDSLLFHLVAAVLWVGGLVASLAHAWRGGGDLAVTIRRFSALALVCWTVMAVSGVVNAWVRLPLHDVPRTAYGLLVLAKVAALLVLGSIGYLQRRHSVRALERTGSRRPLLRLAAVETLVMFVTLGIAGALSRTAPPTDGVTRPSTISVLIGYDLDGPLTVARVMFAWRFDLVFGTAAVVLAVLYPLGVRCLSSRLPGQASQRGNVWPWPRTLAWLSGCLILLLATSSGIGRYAPASISVHLLSQLSLTLVAPALLVLGRPLTLATRVARPAASDEPPGPREWLLALTGSAVVRWLTHPLVAVGLLAATTYGLYFTGLFAAALTAHWAHLAMDAAFLLAGYVFFWTLSGLDYAPRRLGQPVRLAMVFAAMALQVGFGAALTTTREVLGGDFLRGLELPWLTDLLADQHLAGSLVWSLGEIPLAVVAVLVLAGWPRYATADGEHGASRDPRPDRHTLVAR